MRSRIKKKQVREKKTKERRHYGHRGGKKSDER